MLARLFNKKKKVLLGIDVSSSSVKVLELSQSNGRYRVEAYANERLPVKNANTNTDNTNDDEAIGHAVRRAVSRSRTGLKDAAVTVPGSAVIIKTIQMNANLSEDEMDFQIQAEAGQHIHTTDGELALDWEIIGPTEGIPDTLDVLVVACHLEAVERCKDAVELADIDVSIVDVEAFCIERAFPLLQEQLTSENKDTVAIIDMGNSKTIINVIHKGRSIFSREQSFGGQQLTDEIMYRYGYSLEQAEELKATGNYPDDFEAEVLQPFLQSVVQTVSRLLQLFYTACQFNEVDYIVLAGGVAAIANLPEIVQQGTQIKTVVANPFVNMSLANKVNPSALSNDAASLLIACGLAMRSFD